MKWAVIACLLAGCDKLFLQENAIDPDAPQGPPACAPEFAAGRYVVFRSPTPWLEAEASCRRLQGVATFSHLAVVGTAVEGLEVAGLLGGSDAWVGLTSLGEPADQFHWITREAAAIPFVPGEPDGGGACGRMLASGSGLADTPCDETRIAVCECDEFPVDEDRL